MEVSRKKEVIYVTWYFIFILFAVYPVTCVRTKEKIYIELETQSACFRNLNATHQVGCTSDIAGNVGTIHYIQSEADFEWILSVGMHSPYVAVLNSEDFTGDNVKKLYKSERVNGIMVINQLLNTTVSLYPQEGFSSADICPYDKYGMYANDSNFANCKKVLWNPTGTSLYFQDIGIPVIALSDPTDVDAVLNKCYFPFNLPINNQSRDFPVCAAEMKSRMDGAVDSISCLRRTNRIALSLSIPQQFCDPLGDKNVIVTMKDTPQNGNRTDSSVIMIAAKLDSLGLFQSEYKAADTTVAALVTMLATAEALWKRKEDIRNADDAKDIMFSFFQGEAFDYIGSSRMVYEMKKNGFPQKYKDGSATYLHKIELKHLDQIVELNQVGHRNDFDSLWSHTDPLSFHKVSDKIPSMRETMVKFGKAVNLTIQETDEGKPLPPSSAQRFLKERGDIPVIVLTDHRENYTNKFYNSHLDTAELIDAMNYPPEANASTKYKYITRQAELIANLSTTMARYLYNASTNREPTDEVLNDLIADPMTVIHIFPHADLYTNSVACFFLVSVDAKQPFPFYVSVSSHTSEITQLVYSLMARFTGEKTNSSQSSCNQPKNDKRYSYTWMQGELVTNKDGSSSREGWCFQSLVGYTDAVSPAFVIDDYDMLSGQYSTWTESRWGNNAIGVRLFLIPSQGFQASILVVGLIMLVASLGLVLFCNIHSDVIFSKRSFETASSYSPMT
ncbi:unnamed protein product [Lymnaea stagnalis]|uniref:Nicastrin n=1 Tax=Lymnaea stagnalis TaxID=6523 RepID=A0AAV2HST6_LYMST